jgi:H+-transporting ATPase
MVLLFMTNDFLAMSLTTFRASPAPSPSIWRMQARIFDRNAGIRKILFEAGRSRAADSGFVTLVFGAQALLYMLRERCHMWSSKPSNWLLASSAAGIAIVSALALSGILMAPLRWRVLAAVFVAAGGFALILDRVKLPVTSAFKVR